MKWQRKQSKNLTNWQQKKERDKDKNEKNSSLILFWVKTNDNRGE